MSFWDDRYADDTFAYGDVANDFVVEQAHRIPMGRVLCLAEGEGRNAVHLARLGYDVTAVDQSSVGLAKAQRLAARHGVSITTEVANLATYAIAPGAWQGIVSIWAHTPPDLRADLHARVVQGLAPGGVFLLEAYTPAQLQAEGHGGPPELPLLMTLDGLKRELEGLAFEIGVERTREVNEGRYHSGPSAVVQVLAVKPA